MSNASATAEDRIAVAISDDRLSATISVPPGDSSPCPTPADVLGALERANVTVTDAVRERVDEFVRLCADDSGDNSDDDQKFVVAKGRAPCEGKDEELVWDEAFQKKSVDWQDDVPANHYTFNSIVTLAKDQVIGTLRPPCPPRDGVDVTGELIKAKGSPQPLELETSIRRSTQDTSQIISNVPGRFVQNGLVLRIEEELVIPGNIDFQTGNVNSTIHLRVAGAIQNRFDVRCEKSITVGDAIEAATVEATGDILVKGGIVGRNSGRVCAGGEIVAKFCTEADLTAAGDIRVAVELIGCRVRTNSRLIGDRLAVIGGHAYARSGGQLKSLGSDGDVPTLIFLGPSPQEIIEADAIEAGLKAKWEIVERIRGSVAPLLSNVKRLTASQRERATELSLKAHEMEAQIEEEESRRKRLLYEADDMVKPSIEVSKAIYPRVIISIGRRVTVFDQMLKGPIRIEERKVRNVTELVAVNMRTASVKVLRSRKVDTDTLARDYKPLMPPEPCNEDDKDG
ncbi:MAG: DUF342 domain-containing protein [Planctomycetes bacterium]|nr:DUF342 domain-containing protein [Planctomycetota bacterium]